MPNYQAAQYYVYSYFAKILEQPTVDTSFMYDQFGLNVEQIYNAILKRMTYIPSADLSVQEQITEAIDCVDDDDNDAFICAKSLQNVCKNNRDSLLYIYSYK